MTPTSSIAVVAKALYRDRAYFKQVAVQQWAVGDGSPYVDVTYGTWADPDGYEWRYAEVPVVLDAEVGVYTDVAVVVEDADGGLHFGKPVAVRVWL